MSDDGIHVGARVILNKGKHWGVRGEVIGFDERGLVRVLLDPQVIFTRRWSLDPEAS